MTKFEKTNELIDNANILPARQSYIYVGQMSSLGLAVSNLPYKSIHWTKYQIKETDMRIKTATFSSPQYIDLTTGKYDVLITSPYHENFSGLILSAEYDEDKDIYNYQCQDWSRHYMNKYGNNYSTTQMINIIKQILTFGDTSVPVPTAKELEKWKVNLSGLRPAVDYEQSEWGAGVKDNPMTSTPHIYFRDKNRIEIIRDLVFGSIMQVDLWFNDFGILQFEPYQKDDFFNTGLHLETPEAINRKFKFDTTNIITGVLVRNSEDKWSYGKNYYNETLLDFFGFFTTSSSDKTLYSALGNKVNDTTKSTTSSKSTNPYKSKKVWINSDNGSDDFKKSIASKLKSNGWTVHTGGTCSNCHYSDYSNVSKDYIYITLYNGFCAGTVKEAYSSSIQNKLKKKNVQLVIMWDSRTWTNPNGMKPYRYGDFSGYNAKRAWDDNFSSSDPSIKNVSDWLKKNNAIYCVYPTVDGLVEQFEAGGYFKWKANKG